MKHIHSILYHIYYIILLNCIIVDYFILLCHDYLFSIVFIILFLFSFLFFYQFYFHPMKFYLIMCCICCFISYLCYCIYYHFISLFIPRNPLGQKCGEKTNSFILFFLSIYMKTFFLSLFQVTIFSWGHVLNFIKQVF